MLTTTMRALRRILLPVLCTMLALSPALRAVEPFPASLTDDAFWKLVTDASEDDGTFLSENFVSNELGYQYVIAPALYRIQGGGVYVGVGPEQNFTYLAAFHPSAAFIVDIRRQNLIEHLLYKAIFEISANRSEFVSRLFSRKPAADPKRDASAGELFAAFAGSKEDPGLHSENLLAVKNVLLKQHGFGLSKDDESSLEHVYQEFASRGADVRYAVSPSALVPGTSLRVDQVPAFVTIPVVPPAGVTETRPLQALVFGTQFPSFTDVMTSTDADGKNWNFLATESNYQAVREMQRKNLIVPVVGDFAGPKALRSVGRYLKDHDAVVSVFYVSNVEQYLTPAPKFQAFYENVSELPLNSSSTFIRSVQAQGVQPGVAQSSISSIEAGVEAVLSGRAQSVYDILRMPN